MNGFLNPSDHRHANHATRDEQVNAVVFDMDGVIVDTEPIYMQVEQELLLELGITMAPDQYQAFVGASPSALWEWVHTRFGRAVDSTSMVARVHQGVKQQLRSMQQLRPVDGLLSLLERIAERDGRTAVASSSPLEMIQLVLSRLSLGSHFEMVISGDEVRHPKPAPDIFREAARRLGVPASRCTAIEDSTNGVAAAKAAGMRCIALRKPGSLHQRLDHADTVVESLTRITWSMLQSNRGAVQHPW